MIAGSGTVAGLPRLFALSAREELALRSLHRDAELSYAEHGATAGDLPPGYRHVDREWVLGSGEACWNAARDALLGWCVFPRGAWFRVTPAPDAIRPGDVLLFDVRAVGLRWTSLVRTLQPEVESRRVAQSIGTLPLHHASGEERFEVRRTASDEVVYRLRSFSRWKRLAPRVFSGRAAALQRHFADESVRTLRAAVTERLS